MTRGEQAMLYQLPAVRPRPVHTQQFSAQESQDRFTFYLYIYVCFLNLIFSASFIFFPAPSQAPSIVKWIRNGSHVSLGWEAVRSLANESDVMGYKVRAFARRLRSTELDFIFPSHCLKNEDWKLKKGLSMYLN